MGLISKIRAAFTPEIAAATSGFLNGGFFVPSGPPVDMAGSESDIQSTTQGWQVRAWQLWECVGELHEPTDYIARTIAGLVGWRMQEPEELDADTTAERLADIGVTDAMIRLIALNLQVAADFWVVQTEQGWKVFSVVDRALKAETDKARSAGRPFKRFYDESPVDSRLATSSFKAALDPAYELMTYSALNRSQARSRLAQAGFLLVPNEVQFEGGDPFGQTMQDAMTAAIRDVESPEAMAPIKVEMPSDKIDKVKHLVLQRPFDDGVSAKIEQATKRVALALSMPAELLLGIAQSNHWNAWLTQEDTYKGTIAPLTRRIASVLAWMLTVSSPRLVGESGQVPEQPSGPQGVVPPVVLEPDPTDLLARRSSVRDAIDGARIGAVGLEYVRKSMGATDQDKPTAEDLEIIQAMPGRSRNTTADENRGAPSGGDPQMTSVPNGKALAAGAKALANASRKGGA